jgi:ribosome-associated protein
MPTVRTPKAAAKAAPKPTADAQALVDLVVSGIREKKGFDIAVLDVGKLKNVVTDFFVICSGTSDRQTQAISDSIHDSVRLGLAEKPWHTEGAQRGEWILMDYVNVVVHVFQPKAREFYNLEELWGDAEMQRWAE